VLDAAKKREPSRCDAIDASMLRARCQTTVAQVAGDADACPWEIPSRPERGREPACVAIASRQAALCLATADAVARAICEAIVTHDVAPCAKLPTRAGKARCTRDAERWRAAIPAADSSGAARAASPGASGQLHVEGPSAGVDADLAADLARGVVFVEQRDGTRFVLGPLTAGGPGFVASSPQAQGSLALELFTPALPSSERRPAGATPTGVVRRAELQVPGHAPVTAPPARSTLVAKIEELEPGRGGPLRLSVEGEMGDGTGSWRVRYRASTFVRDIVKASAIYDLGIPRLGADGGMR
jgi:hypothetical protein